MPEQQQEQEPTPPLPPSPPSVIDDDDTTTITTNSPTKKPPPLTTLHPPQLSYLYPTPPLTGKEKYLGGALSPHNGKIYCIPGHATRILVIDPVNHLSYPIGPIFRGKFKWLRAVVVENVVYGLPCHSDVILRIDTTTDEVSTIPIPFETIEERRMPWKYHGGCRLSSNRNVYLVPQSASRVVRLNPLDDSVSFVGPIFEGKYKWYGGVCLNGEVYAIPHNAEGVLKISREGEVSVHGNFGRGGHKWHGAAVATRRMEDGTVEGVIVSVPANADTILLISPNPTSPNSPPRMTQIGSSQTIRTGRHRTDGKYKFLGAVYHPPTEKVYCIPSGAERVLEVDPFEETLRDVGPRFVSEEGGQTLVQNKWQNGFLSERDGCIYAIPLQGEGVLKISFSSSPEKNDDEPTITSLPLPEPRGPMGRWEGGVASNDGVMYCMPMNHRAILRIAPDTTKETLTYTTGIPTLRSSAHRVKGRARHDDGRTRPAGRMLPDGVRREMVSRYDAARYDLRRAVVDLLREASSDEIGRFPDDDDVLSLERFCIPPSSLRLATCPKVQKELSRHLANSTSFLAVFDDLVTTVILPHLKRRLMDAGVIMTPVVVPSDEDDDDDDEAPTVAVPQCQFYYQRPPTLRIQPGPQFPSVLPHADSIYGHQNGELNYWIPLTERAATKVDLHVESAAERGDFHPVVLEVGEMVSFHGTSCRHFLPRNGSRVARVSLDFRVGVEGFFDDEWEMVGTSDDHSRRVVVV